MLDLRCAGDSAVPVAPSTYRSHRPATSRLREHLGPAHVGLLAHAGAVDPAALHAARHPRLRTLTFGAPGTRAVGTDATDQDQRDAGELRRDEPWYAAGRAAPEVTWSGRDAGEVPAAVEPFAYPGPGSTPSTEGTASTPFGRSNSSRNRGRSA
ncbi:hypothetical protein ACFU8Q_34965 [Streptomyces sp. NPDC057543]|uniref:hypothetical protein n=1 Tax=Streptomyces sp. NPDC057543 TaxID=3346163 RepID=UPI0036CE6F35